MRRRASAIVLTLAAPLALAACAGHGLTLSTGSNAPPDPTLLLSCARAVAADRGLGVISQAPEQFELQARSAVESSVAAAPSYDVLTVKLSPAKRGFRMLVSSASYALHQLRGATGPGSSVAPKTEWIGTSPSSRVALARDAVLDQCGSVGN
ncbi:MAG: hypothetical protein JO180_05735 [Gemmatirosa sp.]|nr:hypothetical protein [Gemmatirosa sp.]